jgi:RNA polymerase sigma factor (TIGR02999 family)
MAEPSPQRDVTELLTNLKNSRDAEDQLLPLVYDELRRLAASYMRRENAGHTLQATALVHEAYLQLVDQTRVTWQNRAHFFGVAARLMRRILVDHARARNAAKRGGGGQKLTLQEAVGLLGNRDVELEALDDALTDLARLDPQQSRIVELRFFGGLTVEETAEVLGTSPSTIEREWRTARAWLHSQLTRGEAAG